MTPLLYLARLSMKDGVPPSSTQHDRVRRMGFPPSLLGMPLSLLGTPLSLLGTAEQERRGSPPFSTRLGRVGKMGLLPFSTRHGRVEAWKKLGPHSSRRSL